MLEIKNLRVSAEGKEILKGVDLKIAAGETHVIMGKNGSGKSTLLAAIAKNPKYPVIGGKAAFAGKDLKSMSASDAAAAGIFLSFQNAPAMQGLSISTLLKHAANAVRRARGEEPLTAPEFFRLADEYCKFLEIPGAWLKRDMNAGFSGGEKKRISMLEMLFLKPRLAMLDEPDSGVDVDAMDIIARAIDRARLDGTALLIVSHYARLVERANPSRVHLMREGRIAESGGMELARRIDEKGFVDA
ncbi:MAG: Fe-S cluster assembly ATPase SufC [Rickettsiales bacterium]|jgi:Fe-S cluster assembly ATP-binding protein|nr:Fe-S cluster assembly ATPase SufC [Rickettsiales bacterium]